MAYQTQGDEGLDQTQTVAKKGVVVDPQGTNDLRASQRSVVADQGKHITLSRGEDVFGKKVRPAGSPLVLIVPDFPGALRRDGPFMESAMGTALHLTDTPAVNPETGEGEVRVLLAQTFGYLPIGEALAAQLAESAEPRSE